MASLSVGVKAGGPTMYFRGGVPGVRVVTVFWQPCGGDVRYSVTCGSTHPALSCEAVFSEGARGQRCATDFEVRYAGGGATGRFGVRFDVVGSDGSGGAVVLDVVILARPVWSPL